MRAIPGLTIISPADCAEVYKTVEACVGFEHPVYIRLTGAVSCPIVYTEDYEFDIGKAIWLRPAQRVTIISAGTTVGHCLKAAAALEEDGIDVGLLNMHTIKPLDEKAIAKAVSASDTIFVIEEHTRIGGLGSAVVDHIVEKHGAYRSDFSGMALMTDMSKPATMRSCCNATVWMPPVSKILSDLNCHYKRFSQNHLTPCMMRSDLTQKQDNIGAITMVHGWAFTS